MQEARLEPRQVEMGSEEEQQPHRRQALDHVPQVGESTLQRLGTAAQHADDAPDGVPEQRPEHEHEHEHGAGAVDVARHRRLPGLRRSVGGELVPEVGDGPDAHRGEGEQRPKAREDEFSRDGPILGSYAAVRLIRREGERHRRSPLGAP